MWEVVSGIQLMTIHVYLMHGWQDIHWWEILYSMYSYSDFSPHWCYYMHRDWCWFSKVTVTTIVIAHIVSGCQLLNYKTAWCYSMTLQIELKLNYVWMYKWFAVKQIYCYSHPGVSYYFSVRSYFLMLGYMHWNIYPHKTGIFIHCVSLKMFLQLKTFYELGNGLTLNLNYHQLNRKGNGIRLF